MNEIDGISISDMSYDRVCLNCQYWRVSGSGPQCMVCTQGNGLTNPEDTCSMFYHQFFG